MRVARRRHRMQREQWRGGNPRWRNRECVFRTLPFSKVSPPAERSDDRERVRWCRGINVLRKHVGCGKHCRGIHATCILIARSRIHPQRALSRSRYAHRGVPEKLAKLLLTNSPRARVCVCKLKDSYICELS